MNGLPTLRSVEKCSLRLGFGKYRGLLVSNVFITDPHYVHWMLTLPLFTDGTALRPKR